MSIEALVLIGLAGAAAIEAHHQIIKRWEARQAQIASCRHEFVFVSLYNVGEHWNKKCKKCPFSEISHQGPQPGDLVNLGGDDFRMI